ncbi:MAG: hypothetical protein KTR31_06880 [Myxococcales bacterium]|nr:hypothetical protein [Myxococcales bacterium]
MKDPLKPVLAIGDTVTVRWTEAAEPVRACVQRLSHYSVGLLADHAELARLRAGDLVSMGLDDLRVDVPARVISMETCWRAWGGQVVRVPTSLELSRGVRTDGFSRHARFRHISCELPAVVAGVDGDVPATCVTLGPAGLVVVTDAETLPASELVVRVALPSGWVEMTATVLRRDAPRHAFALAFTCDSSGVTRVTSYVLQVLGRARKVA